MIRDQLHRFLIVLGVIFSAYVCCLLVMMNDRSLPVWNFLYGILFSISIFCAGGLWLAKKWAWILSLVLALMGFGLGLYFVHFAWTFWIFQQPTFFDRVFAVLHPRIVVLVLFPLFWFFYFMRSAQRSFFR